MGAFAYYVSSRGEGGRLMKMLMLDYWRGGGVSGNDDIS